jgi:hypothetical protein
MIYSKNLEGCDANPWAILNQYAQGLASQPAEKRISKLGYYNIGIVDAELDHRLFNSCILRMWIAAYFPFFIVS